MAIRYSQEKFEGIPISEDAVSFGKISASNVSILVQISNVIFSGGYSFDTVTITLKGITDPPYEKPDAASFGGQTFSFRNRDWIVTDVTEGGKCKIGNVEKYFSWSVTGVDISRPSITV